MRLAQTIFSVFLISILLLVANFKSNLLHLNSQLLGEGDNYEFLGFQHLTWENLKSFNPPFAYTNTYRYPSGFDYSYGYDGTFAVLSGSLLRFVFSDPATSYNLTVFLIFLVNFLVSAYAYSRILKNTTSGLLTGALFATSPFVLSKLSAHLNLAFVAGLPLLLYSLLDIYNHQHLNQKRLFRLLVSVFLLAMGSLQYFIILGYNFIFHLPILLFLFKNNPLSLTHPKNYFSKYFLLFIPLVLLFWGGYAKAILGQTLHFVQKHEAYLQCCQPSPIDLIFPNQYQNPNFSILNPTPPSTDRNVSLGFVGLGLLVIFIATNTSPFFKKIAFFELTLFILFTFIPIQFPLFPETGRQIVFLQLLLFPILISSIKNINKFAPLILLFILFQTYLNLPYTSPLLPPSLVEKIKQQPGTAILNIPLSKYDPTHSLLPSYTNKKILDGYFHFTAENKQNLGLFKHYYFERFICEKHKEFPTQQNTIPYDIEKTKDLLKAMDIKTVLVNNTEIQDSNCSNPSYWWEQLNPQTILLNEPTPALKLSFFEINNKPNLTIRFFAQSSGKLTIHGLNINPPNIGDIFLRWGQSDQYQIPLNITENGLINTYTPINEIHINAGESSYIYSNQKLTGVSTYTNIWYTFEPDQETFLLSPKLPPEPKLLYSDNTYELYSL